MAVARTERRGVQMRPWELEAAFGEPERRRRRAMRVDERDIRTVREKLGTALTASGIFMEPLVEKNYARKPFDLDEVFLAVEEMNELRTGELRLTDAQTRKLIQRDDKRKERRMPIDMKKRVLWARENVNLARGSFAAAEPGEIRVLLGRGAQVREAEAFTCDAQEFVMDQYSSGMNQARTAWTNLFYATQARKPLTMVLDEAASKGFQKTVKAGVDENKWTREADDLAQERSLPVNIINADGLIVYSVHPERITKMARPTRDPGKLRRQWHYIRKAAAAGVSMGELTKSQSDRVGRILKREGTRPISYITARVLVEEYYEDAYGIDLREMSSASMERTIDVIGKEGILDPTTLAARVRPTHEYEVIQDPTVEKYPEWLRDLDEARITTAYESNPAGARAERAEHEAIWSLKF